MPRSRFTLPALIVSAIMMFSVLPADTFAEPHLPLQLAQAAISLDQAVNLVRQKTGGRILSAKKVNNAEPIYVIKVLMTTGQVKVYRVSAETGEIK